MTLNDLSDPCSLLEMNSIMQSIIALKPWTRIRQIVSFVVIQSCCPRGKSLSLRILEDQFKSPCPWTSSQIIDDITVVVCRHVSQLETCVKSNVRRRCGDRAAHMMSKLVDVSADLSYKCPDRHHHHGSPVTTVSRESVIFRARRCVLQGFCV